MNSFLTSAHVEWEFFIIVSRPDLMYIVVLQTLPWNGDLSRKFSESLY